MANAWRLFPTLVILFFIPFFTLAQETQQLLVRGLRAPVEVLRDQWGINHIYARNQQDLFFAQGYCAAQDRLFQFEIWRRQATGTVAELLGSAEVKKDIGARLFRYRGNLQKEWQHYHPQGAAIIQAYVDGVNAYIDEVLQQPEKLPFEFKVLNCKPGKWTPEVVISRHQGVLANATEELSLGRAVAKAGPDKVKDLKWFHPLQPDLRLDSSITAEMLGENILELYNAFRRTPSFPRANFSSPTVQSSATEKGIDGSNNWVVSGRRTQSGFPILANDPHRAISLPSLRYMVHLVAPGWNVMGAGEPVVPGVSIGHNEHGAWGLTIFETDGEDLYVYDLNPKNLSQYRYRNQWVQMKEIRETIRVRDSASVEAVLRYTVHGPVTFIDTARKKGYALRCAWLEPGGAPYLASLRYNQAKNWRDFRQASRYNYMPGENMIWADRKGNIGWQVVGINPIRKNFSGMVPVPGDGQYEWQGYQDMLQRPHLLNPSAGYFATANEHVTPRSYKPLNTISYTWADPFRGNRVREVLAADSNVTLEETTALQTDFFSIPARTLVPMLRNIEPRSALMSAAKTELMQWDFVLHPRSAGAAIYALWERKLYAEANARFVPRELRGLVSIQLHKLISWLQEPDARFGGSAKAGRDSFLLQTFEAAVNELSAKLGPTVSQWKYGQEKFKHAAPTHPLTGFLPKEQQQQVNPEPLPRGGNAHTPNATGGTDRQGHGASFRMVVDLSDWDKTLLMNSPGQSGDPRSFFYRNLFPLWATDQYFPGYFTREKVKTVTKSITQLVPAK